jgi:DNA-binding NarL/FixJ family response regulator
MGNPYSIAICSQEPLVREGIRRILRQERQFDVIATVDFNGIESSLRQRVPGVLLHDMGLAPEQHLTVFASIKKHYPRMKVVLLLGDCSDDFLVRAVRCRIDGYMDKNSTPEQLIRAIRAIIEGEICVSPCLLNRIVANCKDTSLKMPRPQIVLPLTTREAEIGELVSLGLSNKEVAAKLFISEATVKSHLNEVFKKMHIRHRLQLALYFIRDHRIAS